MIINIAMSLNRSAGTIHDCGDIVLTKLFSLANIFMWRVDKFLCGTDCGQALIHRLDIT